MCLCFCFVWARGFCPSFLCAMCSRQFVLAPPILLPVYWLISPSCSASLPSSLAPFLISLCLQFRVGLLPYVGSSYVLCPALSCLPVCFSPTGLFLFFSVIIIIINKKPFYLHQLGPHSLPFHPTWHIFGYHRHMIPCKSARGGYHPQCVPVLK